MRKRRDVALLYVTYELRTGKATAKRGRGIPTFMLTLIYLLHMTVGAAWHKTGTANVL